MPIQGSAADIIKIAMINIYQRIKARDDVKMLIQVHDELVFEIAENSLNEIAVLINSEMESALNADYRKKVRLLVDIEYGRSWGEVN
jgi:DNA polymerase-1